MTRRTSKQSARRPPGEGPPPADEQDADWGFEQSGEEKVLEPRLGIALAVCLLLVFGFVLYQKYQTISGGKLQADAGDSPPMDSDNSDAANGPPIKPATPTIPRAPESNPDSAISVTEPAVRSSIPDPFASGQPMPAETWNEPTPAASTTSIASAEQSSWSQEGNRFGPPPEPIDRAEISSSPPEQTEPSPFDVPGDFSEPAEQTAPPSSRIADAQPFFDEESAAQSPEPQVQTKPHLIAADESSSPPAAAGWGIGAAPEMATGGPAASDPFAAPTEPEEGTFEWAPPQPEPQEPQAFETVDVAMPVKPDESPGNPFASPDPLPAPGDAATDADPFGEVATSEKSAGQQPPESPDLSDWSSAEDDGQDPADTGPADRLASAPELPALSAPPDHPFAGEEPAAVVQQSPSSVEPPVLEFPPPSRSDRGETGSSTAAAPQAVVGERTVTVTRKDTLWSISQESYGTARYVPALARYNRDRVPHPDRLKPGDHIRVPPPEVLEVRFPELFRRSRRRDAMVSPAGGAASSPSGPAQSGLFLDQSGRPFYRVEKSDTLSRIAQRCLGRTSRWTEILTMNGDRLTSPKTLKPGMVLRMPADAARVAVESDGPFSR